MTRRLRFLGATLAQQIRMAFLLIALVTFVVVSLANGYSLSRSLDAAQRVEAEALARVLAENLAAPLLFRDAETASAILDSLSARDDIVCAVVVDQFGQRFAHFAATGADCRMLATWNESGGRLDGGGGRVVVPLTASGDRVGSLVLESNGNLFAHSVTSAINALILTLAMLLLLTLVVSEWLARHLSRPVDALASSMDQVARAGDYSLTADEQGPGEVRRLAGAFNHMLNQIRNREAALEAHQAELEAKVAERTAELEIKQAALERLVRTDELTGLFNRRHFMELAQQELRRAQRHGHAVSLLMLDLDHFKSVNDTWGHPAGDRVLVAAAGIMRRGVRQTDVVGRLGGEEFALLLPETGALEAQELAWRLCREMAAEPFELEPDGARRTVTCSIGIAHVCPDLPLTLPQLLTLADKGLYKAKHNGRNRVELA